MPILRSFRILILYHARSIGLLYDNRYSLHILKTVVNFTANMKNLTIFITFYIIIIANGPPDPLTLNRFCVSCDLSVVA